MKILPTGTKVRLKPGVQEKRNKIGLTTPYNFDAIRGVLVIQSYEGTHTNHMAYRLKGESGVALAKDQEGKDMAISNLLIPESAFEIV
jgi:hypothetical protein